MKMRFTLVLLTVLFSLNANAFFSYREFDQYLDKIQYRLPNLKNVMKLIGEPHLESINPGDIKILVWNMYKGDKPSWEPDYNYLVKGKDILILQEMFLNQKMTRVFEEHEGYEYHTATSFIYAEENIRTGVATASKIEATKSIFQRSKVVEPVIFTPKMTLFSYFNIEGSDEQLLVANIHAINFVNSTGLAKQIEDIEPVIQKHKGPVIFAGDFNTWSPGKIRYLRHVISRLGMDEVKFKQDGRMYKLGYPLDYVFTRGLAVTYEKVWGSILGSDHKALEVHLKVK